jgi:hypothetical protein
MDQPLEREDLTSSRHLQDSGVRILSEQDSDVCATYTPLRIAVPGERLTSGVHLIRVRGERFTATRRVMIVR